MGVAERVVERRRDVDGVTAVYADDVAVWHNHDDREQDRDENVRVLRWLVDHTVARSYDDVRRERLPAVEDATRIVQQHVLRLTFADGRQASLPACLFVTARGGRVTRIEEYLDEASATRSFTAG